MIENYIKIDDLLVKEPRLKEWEGENSVLENHIHDAFHRTCVELRKLNIDTRRVMTPIFLSGNGNIPSPSVGNWVSPSYKNRVRRFVVKVKTSSVVDNYKIVLEGSNDGGSTVDELVTIVFDESNGTSELTSTFLTEYSFYRYRLESQISFVASGQIYLVETSFDDLIIYKSLQNFFTAKYRKNDDNFASKMALYDKKFRDEINSLVYSYDQNSLYCDQEEEIKSKNRILRIVL